MSIPAKGYQYLNLLSDFWSIFYEDAQVLETVLKTEAEIIKSLYFSFLQERLPRPIAGTPVFDEQFWNLIELVYDEALFEVVKRNDITYYRYPLDEPYAHIPMLYNIIFNPTVRLREKTDYLIERELAPADGADSPSRVNSFILFKEDPFLNNDIAKRIISGNKLAMTLFAPKAFLDLQDLYNKFGTLIGIESISSEEYKAFLHGIFYLFTHGPSVSALNAGLNLAAGYPVARMTENITSVVLEEGIMYLKSDTGNTYEIPRKIVSDYDSPSQTVTRKAYPELKLSRHPYIDPATGAGVFTEDFSNPDLADGTYPTLYPVDRFDAFLESLRVVDDRTEPHWWRKQVSTISAALVPDLPLEVRKNPYVRDYLFETYFRKSTFGVFIDYRAFRADFQKIPDFIDIMKQVKPTYKSFLVYENEFRVFTLVRFKPAPDSLPSNSQPSYPLVTEIDPLTGLPYHQIIDRVRYTDVETPVVDPNDPDATTVFDSIGLRTFLGLEDIIALEKYIAMNLLSPQNPIQIGIGLENIKHSFDLVGIKVKLDITSIYHMGPCFEPIVGMGVAADATSGLYTRIGALPTEGLRERIGLAISLSVADDTVPAPVDSPPAITVIYLYVNVLTTTSITSSGFTVNIEAFPGATGYEIDVTTDGFATFVGIYNDYGFAGTSLAVTGLSAATAYQFRVRAVTTAGTTQSSPPVTVNTAP